LKIKFNEVLVAAMVATSAMSILATPAHAQAAAVTADMAISNQIHNLRESLNGVISAASASVSKNSFEIRQHAEILLQDLDRLGNDLMGKTFQGISEEQRKAFNNAEVAVAQLRDALSKPVADIDAAIARSSDAFGTLPFANRTPRVLRASPSYIGVLSEEMGDVSVGVEGSWLGNDTPSLSFDKTECRLVNKLETALKFSCPQGVFASGEKVEYRTGVLKVYDPKSFWERLKSTVVKTEKFRTYSIGVTVVPAVMAKYTVTATVTGIQRETVRRRTQKFSHTNDHCSSDRHPVWNVNRTSGWKIDPHSIRVHEHSRSSRSLNSGAINRGERGFQLGGVVRNNGDCGPFLPLTNRRAYYDGRGWLTVHATYAEYRDVPTEQTVRITEGEMVWGKDIGIELPPGTKAFRVDILQLDGTKLVEVSERADQRWYGLNYNPNNRNLVIKPKSLHLALQQSK